MQLLEIKLDRPTKSYQPGNSVSGYVEGYIPDNPPTQASLIFVETRVVRVTGLHKRKVIWTAPKTDLFKGSAGNKPIASGSYSIPFNVQLPSGKEFEHLYTFESTQPAMKCIVELEAIMQSPTNSKIATDKKEIIMRPSTISSSNQPAKVVQFPLCKELIPFCCCFCFTRTATTLTISVTDVPEVVNLTKNYQINVEVERSEPFEQPTDSFNLFVLIVGNWKGSWFRMEELENEYYVTVDERKKKIQLTLNTKERATLLSAKYPPSIPGEVDYFLRVTVSSTNGKFINYKRDIDIPILYYPTVSKE